MSLVNVSPAPSPRLPGWLPLGAALAVPMVALIALPAGPAFLLGLLAAVVAGTRTAELRRHGPVPAPAFRGVAE